MDQVCDLSGFVGKGTNHLKGNHLLITARSPLTLHQPFTSLSPIAPKKHGNLWTRFFHDEYDIIILPVTLSGVRRSSE